MLMAFELRTLADIQLFIELIRLIPSKINVKKNSSLLFIRNKSAFDTTKLCSVEMLVTMSFG
jgi:hypothetical protein